MNDWSQNMTPLKTISLTTKVEKLNKIMTSKD